jgi:integrase
MASIIKLTDKHRTLPWRAKVKGKVRMFAAKDEAHRWATEYDRTIRLTGLPPTIEELRRHTVQEIVQRYLDEKTPLKGSAANETITLKKFLRRDICSLSLASIDKPDAYKYVDQRLKETWRGKPITPRTVRREINCIQHIFEVAREEWGFKNLNNPFRVKIKGSMYRRKRRLIPGEMEKLEMACGGCKGLNREYILSAIYLAIETGMRLQEIFNLTWRDVDLKRRRIEIRKSKTDHVSEYDGRTIVMSVAARALLTMLRVKLIGNFKYREANRIFPMTREAFKQSWADVVRRAEIDDLHFHDLRREAGSRFDEAGLTKVEHDLMMGHANKDMRSLYIHADLKSIQDKLDRHKFGGQTWDEMEKQVLANRTTPQKLFDECLKRAVEFWGERLESERPITLSEALENSRAEMSARLRGGASGSSIMVLK